jgi:putative Ca2+/H+ antiporter (TMEM165/GDT1 family)
MNHNQSNTKAISLPGRWFYLLTVFFLVLSGFGQMPIFKRYYIADIPGLAWLAEFFVTHYIHYLGAILFLAFTAYMIIDYLLVKRRSRQMTATGYLRGALLAGILASGILLVIRNLTGSNFSPGFIIFLDLCHMGLVMAFLFASLYCIIFKKQWTTIR